MTEHKHGGTGTAGPTVLPPGEATVQTQALARVPTAGYGFRSRERGRCPTGVPAPAPALLDLQSQSFKGLLGPEMGVGWGEASAPRPCFSVPLVPWPTPTPGRGLCPPPPAPGTTSGPCQALKPGALGPESTRPAGLPLESHPLPSPRRNTAHLIPVNTPTQVETRADRNPGPAPAQRPPLGPGGCARA